MWKLINWIQQSVMVPNLIRSYLLQAAGCQIAKSARVASGVFIGSNRLHMDENTFVNVNCFLDGSAEIKMEEWVRLGPHVKILTGTHTYNNSVLRRSVNSKDINLPVVIKRGSWIGMGAIIMPGISIEEGCIVAAGAVVVKSTEPNGLYAGNPAKRIKDLATELA